MSEDPDSKGDQAAAAEAARKNKLLSRAVVIGFLVLVAVYVVATFVR